MDPIRWIVTNIAQIPGDNYDILSKITGTEQWFL